jgi:ATP-dependent RNA helicase RhlE
VGRTARAEATGDAFTFVSPEEEGDLRAIERAIGRALPRTVLPGFDYARRPAERFEVPIADRIAEIRRRKAEERTRAREKQERRAQLQAEEEARLARRSSGGRGAAGGRATGDRSAASAPAGGRRPSAAAPGVAFSAGRDGGVAGGAASSVGVAEAAEGPAARARVDPSVTRRYVARRPLACATVRQGRRARCDVHYGPAQRARRYGQSAGVVS